MWGVPQEVIPFLKLTQNIVHYQKSGYTVTPRKRTEKLQVDGITFFRFSQIEDLDEGEKTIYGDPGNGFII
ncbi:hypothetical protein JCM12825_08920 [Desulfurobacterium crinifex]